jgi:hypothetical protein
MGDFISLSCPSCGSKLKITNKIEQFSCGSCGNEIIVNRGGGIVFLAPVIEKLQGVKVGVDKTASELAIKRLKSEISKLENQLPLIRESVYEKSYREARKCREVLEDYFLSKSKKAAAGKSFLQKLNSISSAPSGIKYLDLDETIKMAEYFMQDPLDAYKNNGFGQRRYDYLFNHQRKEKSIAKFLYVRELLAPVIIIRDSLKRKKEELRKHEQIVNG